MPTAISFVVYGTPRPQGSMKAFIVGGRARVTSDNAKLKPWRQQVTGTALSVVKQRFEKGTAVGLELKFFFSKPKSAKKRIHMTVKPDLDKLIRAVKDALKGVCYDDDSQVVIVSAAKYYSEDVPESAVISVREVEARARGK